jgi:hypothetical protein
VNPAILKREPSFSLNSHSLYKGETFHYRATYKLKNQSLTLDLQCVWSAKHFTSSRGTSADHVEGDVQFMF